MNRMTGASVLVAGCLLVSSTLAQTVPPPGSKRTPSAQVGAVMALLATFEDAGVLPPEKSPDANRIIKALIQFQSAFMKSENPAVRGFLNEALTAKLGEAAPATVETFRTGGWSSQALEAVVDYSAAKPVWTQPELIEGFRAFNIGRDDFDLLARVFTDARAAYARKGRDIHDAAAARRKEMPGKKQGKNDEL
jgi:hypothetical protein